MRRLILVTVLAGTMLEALALADPNVTATYRPVDSGYRLEFVVYADSLYGFYDWGLVTTALTDLAAPTGWQTGVGVRETHWYTLLQQYRVPAGGVLRGCAATSAAIPGPMMFYVQQTGPGDNTGTVVPTLVPEPTCLLALAAGLGGVAVWRRRRW